MATIQWRASWRAKWRAGKMALTAIGIKKAADGRHGDGGGLELHKKGDGGKWIWRYSISGKRRQMGLGSYPAVSLADARKERDRWASVLRQGGDPISERNADREATRAEIERRDPCLKDLAADVLEARKATLRRDGKSGRWLSPLEAHILPKIGHRPISEIHQTEIKDALAPIWQSKHPTALKAVRRLHIIFAQGKLMGFDCDPFTVEAAKHMLGVVVHPEKPIASTPWEDIPDLFARLEDAGSVSACLQFMILTLVRGSGCRGARFDEIEDGVWTVPSERMKGRVGRVSDFRVPLSENAVRIVEKQRALGGDFLFAGPRGAPVTDASLSKRMRDMGEVGRPHGFRTSFRTWVQDTEAATWEVAETVLAHSIGGRVERSYARSDLLDRRKLVMDAWARHVSGAPENVIKLAR